MSKFERLLQALKEKQPKFFPKDTVYTVFKGEVVKCQVESVDIDWDLYEVVYRYNLYTEEDADGDYDLIYGDDTDTFADEASAKRRVMVPTLKAEIRDSESRIDFLSSELRSWQQKLDLDAIATRIKVLEEEIAREKQTIVIKQEELKKYEEEKDA